MSAALHELDRRHLIHPVANYRTHERDGVTVLTAGRGAWLTDSTGKEVLDAFSGLWCVNVGYGHDSIARVAAEQLERLPYATGYFGFGSEPAIRLAARLAELAPGSLEHVYFTLGGSDAVDSAIRFITHYFNSTGRPGKKHFIALERGYHGSSAVGAGLTALPVFHAHFDVPRPEQHHIPCPWPYRSEHGDDPAALIAASVTALRNKVRALGADNVAAFFCEPVLGSGGVIVPPVDWLRAMREACRELGILFVADEVITGFGRTGPLFACEAEGVEPDLMTVAKGLTAGYAPMGAVLMSREIYAGIADGMTNGAPVGHGHTYSGHPVSAAIGLEVLRLYHEGGLLANGQAQGPRFAAGLNALLEHPLVGDARSRGLLGALELVANKKTKRRFDPALQLGARIGRTAYQQGLIFRSFNDAILGFAPALCYSAGEMDQLFERLRRTLDLVLEQRDVRGDALMDTYKVAVIPGDGIGKEVMPEGLRVLDVAAERFGFRLDYQPIEWASCDYYAEHGRMMPEDWKQRLAGCEAIYFGAVGWPETVPDHVSLWGSILQFRREFDQYINLRPARSFAGVKCPLAGYGPGDIDFLIVRENTEGEYSTVGGIMYAGTEREVVMQSAVFSRYGADRVLRYAFERARERARKHVTVATKSNGIAISMPWWDERAAQIAAEYPEIAWDKQHIDILAARFVLQPRRFDVVVATNLFGDILSDLGPACTGTIGLAPSANLNPERKFPSLFEPVHGSAPDIYGRNIANPVAMIWSGAMMLDFLGQGRGPARAAHDAIFAAIERVLAEGPRTPDLGGDASTTDMGAAIAEYVREL